MECCYDEWWVWWIWYLIYRFVPVHLASCVLCRSVGRFLIGHSPWQCSTTNNLGVHQKPTGNETVAKKKKHSIHRDNDTMTIGTTQPPQHASRHNYDILFTLKYAVWIGLFVRLFLAWFLPWMMDQNPAVGVDYTDIDLYVPHIRCELTYLLGWSPHCVYVDSFHTLPVALSLSLSLQPRIFRCRSVHTTKSWWYR